MTSYRCGTSRLRDEWRLPRAAQSIAANDDLVLALVESDDGYRLFRVVRSTTP